MSRVCSTCGEDFPATKEHFYMRSDRPDRCTYSCKTCTNIRNNNYAQTPQGLKSRQRRAKKHKTTRRFHDTIFKREYGITLEDYEKMFTDQHGKCALCKGVNPSGRKLAIDHNHSSGKVRGLLSTQCNRLLGSYEKLLRLCKIELLDNYLRGKT